MPRVMVRQHGTLTGYRQHTRLGESICRACRDRHNAYRRDWRRVRTLLGLSYKGPAG